MTNDNLNRGEFMTIAAPIAANGGVGPKSGDPLIMGTGTSPSFGLAMIAQTSYTSPTPGAVPTGNISVRVIGVGLLSVKAKASFGGGGVAINPGDRVYADNDGKYDVTTGIYYGFSLTTNAISGIYFGNALDAIGSNSTATIRVRLKVGG